MSSTTSLVLPKCRVLCRHSGVIPRSLAVKRLDYAPGLNGLPKSDILKSLIEDNCSAVLRPSGTEPKLKTYISVSAENKEAISIQHFLKGK